MLYRFGEKIHTVEGHSPLLGGLCAAFLTLEELEACAPALGLPVATVRQCREEIRYFRNSVEVGEGYCFATVKRTGGDARGEDCIALYILPSLLAVVEIRDSDGSTRRGFEGALRRYPPKSVTLPRLVAAFLDTLLEGDARMLEELEFAFSGLEEAVLREAEEEDFTLRLLHHKQHLLLLHSYYEQLIDIGETLGENENQLFAEGELALFRRFTEKADRLCRTVGSLREQLGQLREAYQSTLDIRQNRIMKTFTALSAIFLPLSLIVGWYGMNFNMPEFSFRYGYPAVALLSAAVVLVCIKIFKKHHWM